MTTSYIIIIVCTVIAEIMLLLGGNDCMGVAQWIALAVALIGIAGGIWTQIIQFHKDAQRIDGVNKTTLTVKNDTSRMLPVVTDTGIKVADMRESFLKRENQIDSAISGIGELIEEKHYNDKMKSQISTEVSSPEYMISIISAVYEKNAALENSVRELKIRDRQNINKILVLQEENRSLKEENKSLEQENSLLKNEFRKSKQEYRR